MAKQVNVAQCNCGASIAVLGTGSVVHLSEWLHIYEEA